MASFMRQLPASSRHPNPLLLITLSADAFFVGITAASLAHGGSVVPGACSIAALHVARLVQKRGEARRS